MDLDCVVLMLTGILFTSLSPPVAGKNSGVVKGVKYFKCKDKHGMFVRRDKVTVQSSSPALGKPSSRPPSGKSPLSQWRVSNPTFLVDQQLQVVLEDLLVVDVCNFQKYSASHLM